MTVLPVRAANLLEQAVQLRVVERAREHRDRLDAQRVHQRLQLPEAEMAR